jgi:hypothetical protein
LRAVSNFGRLDRMQLSQHTPGQATPASHTVDHRAADTQRRPMRKRHAKALVKRSGRVEQPFAAKSTKIIGCHAPRAETLRQHTGVDLDALWAAL